MVVRQHGEAYRTTLEREAERLGVREHVVFRDQFVTTDELCSYLQAADIFISPYLNEAQVTSGALSYAMGAGAAVVSTPYWHAQELLADGRGRLFPFGDSDALAETLRRAAGLARRARAGAQRRLRVHPVDGLAARRARRTSSWRQAVIDETPRRARRHDPPPASSLPELRLDHLLRMTDDTGIIQHATFSVPARSTGYCVDDNARALIVALQADRLNSSAETQAAGHHLPRLSALRADRRRAVPEPHELQPRLRRRSASEDCLGRAVWALGTTVQLAARRGLPAAGPPDVRAGPARAGRDWARGAAP